MKSIALISGLICAALAVPTLTAAQETPSYFDSVISKLSQSGYRNMQLVNPQSRQLVGFDAYGSEVSLIIHPRNGTIASWDYVNMRDN
ncbi:hypothetical protein [uncultured Limimaricola sp.]|uniref:hypothetical protein n=1 Tax=uncultured Limimaricola sp. TaxID=2211667 RepID=UPI0030F57F0D